MYAMGVDAGKLAAGNQLLLEMRQKFRFQIDVCY